MARKRQRAGSAGLDLKTFEHKIRVRQMRREDIAAIIDLEQRCFPGMAPWRHDQLDSQLKIFPEGQLCVELEGRVVASCSSLIVDFPEYSQWHDWREIADRGYIRNHDPQGDTLYGIEIMVDPDFRGRRLARRLYDARKELARQLNLMRIIVGGRLPGYGAHAEQMSARDYVERVLSKELYDPVLTPQLANGFVLKGLIPSYLPADLDSRGYATHLEWPNLDYVARAKRQFRAVTGVRVCVVQYHMRIVTSFRDFARQCEFFVDTAADQRSDFIVFPELFTLQLLSVIKALRPGLAARELAKYTSRYLKLFTELAIKYHINIVGGSTFTIEDDVLYNVAYLFRRDGTLAKQYKLHITPSERHWWGVSPGDRMDVFETDRGTIAIQICYDVEFPELSRIAAHKGAKIIFVPFNTNERHGYLRVRHCAQARCIENHIYVATSGCVGNLPFVENADTHYAQSGIFTPADFSFSRDGIAAECTPNIETVQIHDLDIELLRRHRAAGTVQNWNDRRMDMYRLNVTEGDGHYDI